MTIEEELAALKKRLDQAEQRISMLEAPVIKFSKGNIYRNARQVGWYTGNAQFPDTINLNTGLKMRPSYDIRYMNKNKREIRKLQIEWIVAHTC